MDFIDQKKAFPKTHILHLGIDLLVDPTTGYKLLKFRDAYLGYNQIKMYELDMEKTYFVFD